MAAEKHPIRNGIIIAVVSSAILAVLGYFAPGAWSWAKSVIGATCVWSFGVLTMHVTLPFWFLFIYVLFAASAIDRAIGFLLNSESVPESPAIEWSNYTNDVFTVVSGGIRWRWGFAFDAKQVNNIRPVCPDDGTMLVYGLERFGEKVRYVCETCNRSFGPFDGDNDQMLGKVERQIIRKLTGGEWKQIVESQETES